MLHGRLLRYLDEVARCQSMRLAGQRLNVAGSAINRQILGLEEKLGTDLFERQPHKVVLTAAGEVLIDHVRQTLRAMDQCVHQIESLKGLQWGEVSLGVASGIAGTLAPEIVTRTRSSFARVSLRVQTMPSGDIIDGLKAGDLDLGLAFDLPVAGLQLISRKVARLGAVMANDHPLANKAEVTLQECSTYPLCLAQHPLTLRRRIDSAFAAASMVPQPVVETDSIELLRRLASQIPYITFLSPFDIFHELRETKVVHVPVRRVFANPEEIVLLGRTRGFSPLAGRVAEMCRDVMNMGVR